MHLAELLKCSMLVAAAVAVVRQQHYTKLKPTGFPHDSCLLNSTNMTAPPTVVARPFWYLMWCGALCEATAYCRSFCIALNSSSCELYSSIIGLQYDGSTTTMGSDVVCYSASASIFNIIGGDTPISTSSSLSTYDVSRMTNHVYHPCLEADPQSYYTQFAPAPWIRFDFGKEEIVEHIYITAYKFNLIDIRLGNSLNNTANPVIYYLAAAPEVAKEFSIPLVQRHNGRYLSFNSRDGATFAYVAIGEVRVLRAFG